MLFQQERTSNSMNNFKVYYVNMGRTSNDIRTFGIMEGELSANRKHVWFSAYNLRMERGTVLILTWLSAQYQYL